MTTIIKLNELDFKAAKYIDYISNKEFRLEDGTLARNRSQANGC
ncbi:hypothetical protein [Sunxiuqinia indica]|nr:hypothetical protein [Sunxiuqinia indica]